MKLSVITINYNNREGLEKTVDSVVNQTYKEFQYIVIDGGSTDGSLDVINNYSDRIAYWVSEPDRGIYHAMNKGIDVAKGEYCIFMNSGDCFYDSNVLGYISKKMNDISIIYGKSISLGGNPINHPHEIDSLAYFFMGNTINHQSAFIKTSLLKLFKYDEKYKIISDYKLFILAILNGYTYKYVDSFISIYDDNGISSLNRNLFIKERQIVLDELLPNCILNDYKKMYYGWESRLYNEIRTSRFHKWLYSTCVFLIYITSLFRRNSNWIKKYPFFLKNNTK